MKNSFLSKPAALLFVINMWGLAIVGTLLALSAVAGLAGVLPEGSSLHMLGRPVITSEDHYAFMIFTGSLAVLGWLFVWLRLSGHLVFSFPERQLDRKPSDQA